jgi:hypothetical protein
VADCATEAPVVSLRCVAEFSARAEAVDHE